VPRLSFLLVNHYQLSVFRVNQTIRADQSPPFKTDQRYPADVLRQANAFLSVAALTGRSHRPPRVAASSVPGANAVQGRVLWNEQPAAGARVVATSLYDFSSTQYGEAITDTGGHFTSRGVLAGQKYL
jgi:hypothetical protein